jgi:hypothetical protein
MKRPFHALAVAGTTAHHAYELSAGVGLVWQPFLGLPGSLAFWAVNLTAAFWMTQQPDDRFVKQRALALGSAFGGAAVHYTLWPWKLKGPPPVLTEAEGLSQEQLPPYNAILLAWAAAAALALARETPKGARRWFLLGAALAVPFRFSAAHHFKWAREKARTDPAWWNRGLQEG